MCSNPRSSGDDTVGGAMSRPTPATPSRRRRPAAPTERVRGPLRTALFVLLCIVVIVATTASCTLDDDSDATDPIVGDGGSGGAATVDREIDGDSLELLIDGEVVEVRLVGINAPELADCQGPAARAALGDRLGGATIDVTGREQDRFDRLLVELSVDGESVNESMVRDGWALAVHGDGDRYVSAMIAAADERVGLWAGAIEGCTAWLGDVRVIDAAPDPPGRDDENLNGEYVVLENADDAGIDLTGWQLRDESTSNRFVFDRFALGPDDEVTVYVGCGQNSEAAVYWCSEGPVWSNDGETVMLLGPDGTYVSGFFLE